MLDFLCKYKDIFGKPGQGVHSYRIMDIAIVDILLTIFSSWLVSKYYEKNFWIVFSINMILSIIVHKFFCVDTTLTRLF